MTDYFNDYYFTSNRSDYTCPGFGDSACPPPKACARDPNTGRRYCCDYQHPPYKGVCWALAKKCASDGSTVDCGTGDDTWCCIDGREKCTERTGQINVCWSTSRDTLNNITTDVLNDTYSSLSSAKPSATTWAFTPISLVALTNPAITQTQTPNPDASSTGSSVPSTTPTDDSDAGTSLGGGAIAGVVVGALGGVALLGLGVFMLWKRQKRRQAYASVSPTSASAPIYAANGPHDKTGGDYSDSYAQSSPAPPTELQGDYVVPQELPGSWGAGLHGELSATSPAVSSFGTSTAAGGSPHSGGATAVSNDKGYGQQ
ncbi:hypothetical protein F503_00303 [Ophiostoma piceae UAMH 11346]|uniref:Uncharacterized protein n=1 Tax=Ophiostoma piceae (strain UAMH 11346) TaxID=1262450 RepID=S3C6Q2_OPHP1|nr:hypothetical protein F503_00303 [Ophiostoma piceae UAMH 11346]